jgi:hypothetical protein
MFADARGSNESTDASERKRIPRLIAIEIIGVLNGTQFDFDKEIAVLSEFLSWKSLEASFRSIVRAFLDPRIQAKIGSSVDLAVDEASGRKNLSFLRNEASASDK